MNIGAIGKKLGQLVIVILIVSFGTFVLASLIPPAIPLSPFSVKAERLPSTRKFGSSSDSTIHSWFAIGTG